MSGRAIRQTVFASLFALLTGCGHWLLTSQPPLTGPILALNLLPPLKPEAMLVQKQATGVEAYAVYPGDPLVRVRTWPGARSYLMMGWPKGPISYAVIDTAEGAELYKVGDYGVPLLDKAALQTSKVRNVLTIRAFRAEDALWRGMALQEEGDAQHTGQSDGWRLFATEDGEHWAKMIITGAPPLIRDVRRFGVGEMALQSSDGWHLFRRSATHGWEPFELAGIHGALRLVDVYDGGHALAVADAAEGSPKRWFYRTADAWTPIEQAIEGAPTDVVTLRSIIDNRVLAIRPGSGEGAFHDRYFVRVGSAWRKLSDVLEGAPAKIAEARAFAGDRGLALLPAATVEAPVTAVAAYWFDNDKWSRFSSAPNVLTGAWRVIPSTSEHAFAVRTGSVTGDGAHSSTFQWLFESGTTWAPIAAAIPADAGNFDEVDVDAAGQAVAIHVESSDAKQPPIEQRIFLREGERFVPFSQLVTATWKPKSIDALSDPEAILRVLDTTGQKHFLLREGPRFVDLSLQLAN